MNRIEQVWPLSLVLLLTLTVTCGGGGDADDPEPLPDVARWVDPLIGTRGPGNTVPGPCVPHGMVKLSPDTDIEPGGIDAYEYSNGRIEGFSHTHLEGPGGGHNGYSQILLTAINGPVKIDRDDYASTFSHESEIVEPGYYAVTLEEPDVRAEITASAHCGVHRYTFPAGTESRLIVDLAQTRGEPLAGSVTVVGDDTIEGRAVHQVNPLVALLIDQKVDGGNGVSTIYFSARFSRPFESFGTWSDGDILEGTATSEGMRVGAWAGWSTESGNVIEVRVGISFISLEQARANLEAQAIGRTFEEVRALAYDAWNRLLARLEVKGGTDDLKVQFYTALYHSLLQPADYTEDGRFWNGSDGSGSVFDASGWRYYTDNWCIWDTFRTTHPLLTLVEPEVVSDMVQSLVHAFEQGGWMPKCTWNATGYSRVMTANNQFCVVADAYLKGLAGFDTESAWDAMVKGSNEETDYPLIYEGVCGYSSQGTPPDYVNLGYVAHECDPDQSASVTLEHAYNDWCVALFAEALGRADDRDHYMERSLNYRNLFNPEHGMIQAKKRNGDWVEPFDPTSTIGFTEANSWEYTWFVPQDVCGLVDLMGGPDDFVETLDRFFDEGFFTSSNEPDFHAPWLYDAAGMPWKTQDRVRTILDDDFSSEPGGLPGNDDAGATSAWYVFAAVGFFPVAPGNGEYWISSPIFERIVLHLDAHGLPGGTFVIEAPGVSTVNRYIQSATLNGSPLDQPRLQHKDLVSGGTLVLEMGPQASEWGKSTVCIR
ncbi:MAG: GH92 family glycosyl hydrolase [Deltaproteobacteria bacterium]|nr:GH92 family glycosyl hydrolase [Deltaproteobacteria bacterium]